MSIVFVGGRVVLILNVLFCIFLCSCSKPEEALKPEEVFYYHIKDSCPGCQSHASIHVYTMVAKSPKPGLMTKGMKGSGRYIGPIIRRDGETYSIFPKKTIQVIDNQTKGYKNKHRVANGVTLIVLNNVSLNQKERFSNAIKATKWSLTLKVQIGLFRGNLWLEIATIYSL